MVVKSIAPLSVGKIYGALSAVMGLLFGLIFGLISMAGAGMQDESFGMMAPMLGMGAIIALPLFYGAMGFVVGILGALLYNLFAGIVGGVEIRTE